jgi:hypothetical protein
VEADKDVAIDDNAKTAEINQSCRPFLIFALEAITTL